jgi:catechol 2,3-dioxygenase-like lactoylglutathione lyase family enzyme
MTDQITLDTIGQIHVTVTDIDESVAFYRDVLGMKFLFQVPDQDMAFFDCGGVRDRKSVV